MYPKLISMNTINFDFEESNFTEKLMTKKDKNQQQTKDLKTREGAGRVAIHKDCGGLIYSFTMECNYSCGIKLNKINKRLDTQTNKFLSENDPILDQNSKIYK